MVKQVKSSNLLTSKVLFLIGYLFILSFHFAIGQDIKVKSSLDTNSILIGEQTQLHLSISHPENINSTWAEISDSIKKIEIVRKSKIDTALQNGIVTKSQSLTLTSFDSGYHAIPPFEFSYVNPGDTISKIVLSDALLLMVTSIDVDTTKAIKDIKDLRQIPYTWRDFLPYIFGIVVLLLLIYLIYSFIKRRKKKGKVEVNIPLRPAHEIALEALQKLDEAKMWQQGLVKEYHSNISEIIRTFIGNRWDVPAMEMTSDEIMQLQFIKMQNSELNENLNRVLQLADLVKFAKAFPIHHENEQSIKVAYQFVRENILSIDKKLNDKEGSQ